MIRKRKKPKDYKIRIFTAILFLIIVFLVSIIFLQGFIITNLLSQCELCFMELVWDELE